MDNPLKILLVWFFLLGLLALSVGSAYLDLGAGNTIVNFAISTLKALLVAWFYMHLRSSALLVRTTAVVALVWLALLIGLSLGDYLTRSVVAVAG